MSGRAVTSCTAKQADSSDPATDPAYIQQQVIAGYVCSSPPPAGAADDYTERCYEAARRLAGALGNYCGCPCKHQDQRICMDNLYPEVRARELLALGSFANLPQEFQAYLMDPNEEFSLVNNGGYCPDEIPTVIDQMLVERRAPDDPLEPYSCSSGPDETIFMFPPPIWLGLEAGINMAPTNGFLTPWSLRFTVVGYSPTYMMAGGSLVLDILPAESRTDLSLNGDMDRGSTYMFAFEGETGVFVPFNYTAGMHLSLAADFGGTYSDGPVPLASGGEGDISGFQIRAGAKLKLFLRLAESFAPILGLQYMGIVTDTELPRHWVEFLFGFDFGGFD